MDLGELDDAAVHPDVELFGQLIGSDRRTWIGNIGEGDGRVVLGDLERITAGRARPVLVGMGKLLHVIFGEHGKELLGGILRHDEPRVAPVVVFVFDAGILGERL